MMKISNLFRWGQKAELSEGSNPQEPSEEPIPVGYTTCLNCGASLVGKFCHQCGQKASVKEPDYKFRNFLFSYFTRIYLWHPRIPHTLYALLTKPGYLLNEYIAGKHTTYTDPLVINRFFLLVITTLFGFFPIVEDSSKSLETIMQDEPYLTSIALTTLEDDKEFMQLMENSSRDTIQLNSSLPLIRKFPNCFTPLSIRHDSDGQACDTLIASVPSILLEENVLIGDATNGYHFSLDSERMHDEMNAENFVAIWKKMVDLTRRNIGLIVLLICPILASVIGLLHWRNKREHMHYFIFAMYYSCVVEVILLLAFLLTKLVGVSSTVLECIILPFFWGYLTVFLKNAFVQNSWFTAALKAMIINLVYGLVIFLTLCLIFIIALVWIIIEQTA